MLMAEPNLTDKRTLELRIVQWLKSPEREWQLLGEEYYRGNHDIMRKKRMVPGEEGEMVEVKNLPNNCKVDNQYAKMVDQKKNYLLGQPIAFKSKNKTYVEELQKVFNRRFHKILKDIGHDCLTTGISWVYPYIDNGKLKFKRFAGYEILPFWSDSDHTEISMAVRYYLEEKPNAKDKFDVIQKIEIYTKDGIDFYTFENNRLIPDLKKSHEDYITVSKDGVESGQNWEQIPLIPFKANAKEISLLSRCKSLQDGINEIISTFKDNMEEDSRNTILVLENYDGQDLGEFRRMLAQYGAVKVRSGDGARGDVRTLNVTVNATNYDTILKMFKNALIENCKGYDFSELRNGGTPNQMNIKSVYSNIDLDANDMETECQCGMEVLLWFVNNYLNLQGKGDFDEEFVEIIFNRDGIVNEVEVLQTLVSMGVKISNKTLAAQVPFVDDVDDELRQLKKEEQEALDAYAGAVPMTGDNKPQDVKKNV